MFRYWVMVRDTEEGEERKSTDHAFEESACEAADAAVRAGAFEARVVDRIHMKTVYQVGLQGKS